MNTVTTRDGVEVLMKPKDTEINIDEACLLIGQVKLPRSGFNEY